MLLAGCVSPAENAYEEGTELYRHGDFAKALEKFDKAIADDPKFEYAYNNRALALEQLGKIPEAEADATKSIELGPQDPKHYAVRARLLNRLGKTKEAIADANRAISIDNSLSAAYLERGQANFKQGKVQAAVTDLKQAVLLDPADPAFRKQYAKVLAAEGYNSEAQKELDKVKELNSRSDKGTKLPSVPN